MPQGDVAIVGMACRFAGDAKSPDEFYEMLLNGRDSWSKVPSSRFNVDARHHPWAQRRGSLVCNGGYFLRESEAKWDAPFFSCSAVEARAMDPQQRLLLEVAYESLENAGFSLEAMADTETGCFVGGFTNDYKTIIQRDTLATPHYSMPGCALALLSNRVSWFYNLRGPSVTLDTACSSSLTALHLACESINSESNKSRCALHIDDAIRDGDAIRAVIRASGINSDGRTAGIVLPNGDAQERLIRATYQMSGLDPADTQYVEFHGTGTRAGDPTEMGAVSRAMASPNRSTLYGGSVKTQIGHTEAAAGLAGLVKCVLAMERGIIPPQLNFDKPNPRLQLESSNVVIPTAPVPWPECETRRCSVNSFGFGGTNAHIILDDGRSYRQAKVPAANGLLSLEASAPRNRPDAVAVENESAGPEARVFVLSAPEKDAVARQCRAHADHVEAHCTADMLLHYAYTLGERRSTFQWRHAVVAGSIDALAACWRNPDLKAARVNARTNIAFVLTGQGAQWHAMGRELISFDVFASSIRQSAACLAALGCPWDAWCELMKSESASNMALVDLLEHWGVKPSAVVGHSSGEIAAAYAAQALSRESCLNIAYQRGVVSEKAKTLCPGGSMMAVGLSVQQVQPYLARSKPPVVVGCVNSPSNITLTGDRASLEDLRTVFEQENIFCRLLQVDNAYHSQHMLSVRDDYLKSISDITPVKNSAITFYSTVLGREVPTAQLTADYWVDNMCSPVEFVSALDDMVYANTETREMKRKSMATNLLVEIGPHGALGGPIQQFKVARGGLDHLDYCSLLSRGKGASLTAMTAAASLWMKGASVDLTRLNRMGETSEPATVLANLPSYRWNHSTSYWHETRVSRNERSPAFPRHDLIGNYLRLSEVPWLKDHQVHGDIVFPAAGMICAVIEALRQHAASNSHVKNISGFELRDISISRPLIIPNDDAGIETYLHLKRRKLGMRGAESSWFEFSFCSCQQGDEFVEHACGLAQVQHARQPTEVDGGKELREEILAHRKRWVDKHGACEHEVPLSTHFEFCKDQGIVFGNTFQGLSKIHQNGTTASFEVTIPDSRSTMPESCESDYLLHPSTLDAVIQTVMVAVPRMDGVPKQAWVPTAANSIRVSSDIAGRHGDVLHGICDTSLNSPREMASCIMAGDGSFDTLPGLIIDDIRTTGLGSTRSSSQLAEEASSTRIYASPTWKPDLELLGTSDLRRLVLSKLADDLDMGKFCFESYNIVTELCRLALQKIGSSTSSLPPHLQKYVGWLRARPHTESQETSRDDSWVLKRLKDFSEKYPVDGNLLRHVFDSLDAIFAQEAVPIAVLMANENFSKYYREAHGMTVTSQIFRDWFDLKAHKKPSLRVIEIGAGTAATTLPVLQQLGNDGVGTPRFSKWTFTDISPGWFENARILLGDWKQRVEYKVLDIEKDPVDQGFEAETYDVVLAVNVLHATKNIQRTLENCKRLLKPGGNLVLGEITNRNDIGHFIVGVLPGWWAAEDGRKNGPLLLQSEWDDALKEAGFSGTDVVLSDNDDVDAHRVSNMVSTKPHNRAEASPKTVVVVVPDDGSEFTERLGFQIRRKLQHLHANVVIKNLKAASAEVQDSTVISLLEYELPIFEDIKQDRFNQVKHLLLYNKQVLWVTRSDPDDGPGHPSKRIVSGLIRCLKSEDGSRRPHELHFCRPLEEGDVDSASSVISRRICSIWQTELSGPDEMETVEQNGVFAIPRYMPEQALNSTLARIVNSDLAVGQPGMLDTLHFVDDEAASQHLLDDEVYIEVQACALNFLDIMIAMGEIQRPVLGYEAAALSLEDAVSIPVAYSTAYYTLIEIARLKKRESVLIHAAAGGLGQALIQIAKLLEAEIFCTAGSESKKQAIVALGVMPDHIFSSRDLSFDAGIKRVTQGRGVDVVVNSLAGEALRFNLEDMIISDPPRASELVSKVLKLFEAGDVDHIRPIVSYDISNIESAFREMQRGSHIGKLVLRITSDSQAPVIPPKPATLRLRPDATYLLVGGLGGLGRAQALFMADLFHKMSYRQWATATKPKIQGSWNLHQLLPDGLDFFVLLSSLAGIVGSISQANYAAGNTYQDALVHYRRSKGLAAQSIDLGVIGGIGYIHEHQDVAARMNDFGLKFFHLLQCALASTGDGKNSLPRQLLVGACSGGIMQAAQKTNPDAHFSWLQTFASFAYLRELDVQDEAATDVGDKAEGQKLLDQLRRSKSIDEAIDTVQQILLARISKIVSVAVTDINTTKPVHTYGVDSLVAVELRNWLAKELKSDMSIFDLTSNAPISDVCRKIAGRSQLIVKN
ncbi:polyketide synthase dehydratase domain-containing protein [Hirsutella rhossiliensis]|uniref:Polyketide synthase dehydratase domain-containing protein n=1 Tax=Hirsutella rhossiliensis TaxID=111463 RepID=A0A9P8MLN7_9HYPO|nr:polyketide synthase dehydratase domain-containing protein [Hirsutella rhossiliensis]KAH0958528.1 polyketide synthase dehydratase domain-containing protein [Hirsutella rhossiliensis]